MPLKHQSTWSNPILIRPAILFLALFLLTGAALPDNGPMPEPRPDTAEMPAAKDDSKTVEPKQAEPAATKDETKQKEAEVLLIEKEDPAALSACMTELKTLGVTFKEIPRIDDRNGCGIDHPFSVTAVGRDIALKPEGTMRCETARQLARWAKQSVIPTLTTAMPGETLSALNQASAYICRKRNSAETGKISEHARGNAVDIASFTFKSGKTFSIEPRMKDSTLEGAFQRTITAAACLHFTTVLDPGSDSAHETHLHLDVIKRKNGYRYCW